jgi:hypothetical protein
LAKVEAAVDVQWVACAISLTHHTILALSSYFLLLHHTQCSLNAVPIHAAVFTNASPHLTNNLYYKSEFGIYVSLPDPMCTIV